MKLPQETTHFCVNTAHDKPDQCALNFSDTAVTYWARSQLCETLRPAVRPSICMEQLKNSQILLTENCPGTSVFIYIAYWQLYMKISMRSCAYLVKCVSN
jgi:hypothetical protein